MRARELLEDNYLEKLESDLNNIIIGAKGAGAHGIDTDDIVDQLYSMGYSVNINSIMQLLDNNPAIISATPETITFSQQDGTSQNTDSSTDSAAQVSDMAQQAVDI